MKKEAFAEQTLSFESHRRRSSDGDRQSAESAPKESEEGSTMSIGALPTSVETVFHPKGFQGEFETVEDEINELIRIQSSLKFLKITRPRTEEYLDSKLEEASSHRKIRKAGLTNMPIPFGQMEWSIVFNYSK